MYLSLKQHDLFRTLLMGFEVPFRSYIADVVISHYPTYIDFSTELNNRKATLSLADPIFLRDKLPSSCTEKNCAKLYARFVTANQNRHVDVITSDNDVPMVGHLNIVTFAFQNLFADLYLRFLYKGIIIKHNKTEPTYTKTSLFLCEKRRFFMARTEKGVVTTI